MIQPTGECFVPEASNAYEIMVNVERYLYAQSFTKDKVVLDAACGSGLGAYLYGLQAKELFAVDRKQEHLDYAKKFPHEKPVHFLQRDLDTDLLPECDVCISLETIEHLEHPDFFLSQLKCKTLVFSLPKFSLATSKFHKVDIQNEHDVRDLLERDFLIKELKNQDDKWFFGYAVKK